MRSGARPSLDYLALARGRSGEGSTEQLIEAVEAISKCPSAGSEPGHMAE
jgi:hypothetical protein